MKLKVLSYNTNKSRNWHFLKDTFESIKDLIRVTDADIVFLQEVVGENSKREVENPHFEELADEVWHDFAYAKNSVYEKGHHGNAILSKYPIVKWEHQDISNNKYEQRGILYAQIEVEGKPINLYCVHLDLLQKGREKQIDKIVERIKKESIQTPFILAGDFNDWNLKMGAKIEIELDMLEVGKKYRGEYLKTFPSWFPFLRLDRVYCRGLEVLKSESLTHYSHSDHLPLYCELKKDEI